MLMPLQLESLKVLVALVVGDNQQDWVYFMLQDKF